MESLLEFERSSSVKETVAKLAEPYRSTIVARYFKDLSIIEIAQRQVVPLNTVKTRQEGSFQLRFTPSASSSSSISPMRSFVNSKVPGAFDENKGKVTRFWFFVTCTTGFASGFTVTTVPSGRVVAPSITITPCCTRPSISIRSFSSATTSLSSFYRIARSFAMKELEPNIRIPVDSCIEPSGVARRTARVLGYCEIGQNSPSPKWHWLPIAKERGGFGWQNVICSIRARPRSSCCLRRRQKLSARMNRIP